MALTTVSSLAESFSTELTISENDENGKDNLGLEKDVDMKKDGHGHETPEVTLSCFKLLRNFMLTKSLDVVSISRTN